MALAHTGMSAESVAASLAAFKAHDIDWKKQVVWGYIYPAGEALERVQKAAYMAYLTENALDPTVFPSVMAIENALVNIGLSHLGGDPTQGAGNFTSGGTESIILAVKTARDFAREVRGISDPEIVLPVTAHAAFHKAAHYLGLRVVRVDVDPQTFRADGARVGAAITDQTVLVVCSAPQYAHGVVDDVEGIAAAARKAGVPCHVDACVGGWMLPFFRELGEPVPPFDFAVPGVSSISVDLHKYALCAKGASLILYADKAYREYQIYACAGWTGYTVINPTVQSTKTGGPVASAWATLHYLGRQGYLDHAQRLLDARRAVVAGLGLIDGVEALGAPEMCMVSFRSTDPRVNIFDVADEMKARGWYIQPQLGYQGHPPNIHVSIHPGVVDRVRPMLEDLRRSVESSRGLRSSGAAPAVELAGLPTDQLDEETYRSLLEGAGVQGIQLPDRMAGINDLLQSLPIEVRQRLLIKFFNDINHGDALGLITDAGPVGRAVVGVRSVQKMAQKVRARWGDGWRAARHRVGRLRGR